MVSLHSFAQQNGSEVYVLKTEIISSRLLGEDRKINIYLPDYYDTSGRTKYPVIYILDGGVQEDFIHLTGLVRYNSQPWVARIPESIVVGIENTNRRKDFTFAVTDTDFIEKEGFKKESFPQYGNSDNYRAFLEKELQPYIHQNFHVSDDKTLIGESLAALMATEILLKQPSLFTNYIIISPSLWWGERQLLKNAEPLLAENLKQKTTVYIGAPSKKEDVRMYRDVRRLFKNLQGNKRLNVSFNYMPDETHTTVIHQAVYNAFKIWNSQNK